MPGLGLHLTDVALRRAGSAVTPTPTPTPTPSVASIVIEGDSITYAGGSGNNGFAWTYAAAPPSGKTASVNAENSRTVGGAAYNGDLADPGTPPGNTTLLHVSDDISRNVVLAMIGTNDLASSFAVATYKQRLIDYGAALHAGGVKFGWSPPIPMCTNAVYDNAVPGGYDAFTAKRATLMTDARNPAVWGQWADFYYPMGEQPDFNAADNTAWINNTDGVHPTQPGQDLLGTVLKPVADTIFDASRVGSTQMYSARWIASETNLATSTTITRSFVVSGLDPAGTSLGASVAGGGGQIKLNAGSYGTSIGTGSGNGYRIYNGDTITLKLTTSSSNSTAVSCDLTVGSETRTLTYTTVAMVTPVSYTHGAVEGSNDQVGGTHTYAARSFLADGMAIVAVNWSANVTGVSVGGVAATQPTGAKQNGDYGASSIEAWLVPVTAGVHDVTITASGISGGQTTSSEISWGVVTGADATPTTVVKANDADTVNLATPSITVPASGLAIGLFGEYAGGSSVAPASVTSGNTGTTGIDEGQIGYNGEVKGIAVAKRTATGAFSWDFAGGGYSPHPRLALAFKAAGT